MKPSFFSQEHFPIYRREIPVITRILSYTTIVADHGSARAGRALSSTDAQRLATIAVARYAHT